MTKENTEAMFWAIADISERRPHPYAPSETPCIIWPGAPEGPNGYGRFMLKDKRWKVHALALALSAGDRPEGAQACHSCDIPLCWNPLHLRWGTPSDNVQDMVSRGRAGQSKSMGEDNGKSKLTKEQVLLIREAYSAGDTTQGALAKAFGVHKMQISKIINRKAWRHL